MLVRDLCLKRSLSLGGLIYFVTAAALTFPALSKPTLSLSVDPETTILLTSNPHAQSPFPRIRVSTMPPQAEIINGKKTFTILENNPEVFNALSAKLGLSPDLEWHDVYSFTEPSLLSLIPRPVLALLVIMPSTPAWRENRAAEDKDKPLIYPGKGSQEPVLWFEQTIGEACGSIGLIHCLLNGPAKSHLQSGSWLAKIKDEAVDLGMDERAKLLYDSHELEVAHQSVAEMGDSRMPSLDGEGHTGQHFVAFVKEGGRLWELEGNRRGPMERGVLGEDEDALCPRAIELGIGRVMDLERASGGGDFRFSCIALAKKVEE